MDLHNTLGESSSNNGYSNRCFVCDVTIHTDNAGFGGIILEAKLHCLTCYGVFEDSMKENRDNSQNGKRIMITEGGESFISDQHDVEMDTRSEYVANLHANSSQLATGEESPMTNTERAEDRLQSSSVTMREVLETSQDNAAAPVPDVGSVNRDNEVDIEKSWKMLDKAKQIMEKGEMRKKARKNSQPLRIAEKAAPKVYKRPPMRKSRASIENNVCVNSSINEVSHLNGTIGRLWNGSTSVGCSDEPERQIGTTNSVAFGESSQVPHMCLSIGGKGVSSATEKRGCPKNEDGKAHIQSLVKHCLSSLPKDKKKLGTNGYKEVARVSTHTILATLGLEHNAALARSFAQPICNHGEDMSDVMPSSCRNCFNGFVKQVVESVFIDRM